MLLFKIISIFAEGTKAEQIKNNQQLKLMLENTEDRMLLIKALPMYIDRVDKLDELTDKELFLDALSVLEAIFRKTRRGDLKIEELKRSFISVLENKIAQPNINKKIKQKAAEIIENIHRFYVISFNPWG